MIILTTSTSFYGINQVYVRQKLPHRNILYESQSLETSWKKKRKQFWEKKHNVFIIDIRCDENQNNKNGKFGQQQTSFFFI